jgi:uncharacterized membrane protein
MSQFIKKILLSTIILLILDTFFIYFNRNIFGDTVVNIQRVVMQIKPGGALFVYVLLALVLNFFIILKNRSPLEAYLLGFCIFGIFEGTNYTVFKKWTLEILIMDTFWGGSLFALTTYFTYMLSNL